MPELPDITLYQDALRPRIVGQRLQRLLIKSPFLLRTFEPAPEAAEGRIVESVSRLGKRIVLSMQGGPHLVLHLMIAGRLLWKPPGKTPAGKIEAAAWQFDEGTLVLTEAGTKKRASLHVAADAAALAAHDPGGVEPMTCSPDEFRAALLRENRTLKRALTNPRLFGGIGNAYSDEILHAAKLSPIRLTHALTPDEASRLHSAARETIARWITILRRDFGMIAPGDPEPAWNEPTPRVGRFPGTGEITAFRPGFAVHGRFGLPCPVCGSPVQRIVHAENETNYCATCQTGGKVLADRSLSRLLKDDWPRTIEEWEEIGLSPGAAAVPKPRSRRKGGPADRT